ncbi:MAG: biopolymer transporter ExbD, partial [Pseudomonadota bacterium]
FFMLASTFLKFSAMPIAGAKGGGGTPSLDEIALIQLGGESSLTVNGQTVELQNLRERIESLVEGGVKRALVRSRTGASVQDIVKVLEITKATRLENVVVVK